MQRVCFLLIACCVLFFTAHAQSVSTIVLQQPHIRTLSSTNSHTYELSLQAGEYARLDLQCAQTRLQLALLSETNELIVAISEVDSPQQKRLDITANQPTKFLLRVSVENLNVQNAQYQLTLSEKRSASAAEQERFALHKAETEIVKLYRQQEKSALQQAADKARLVATRWMALHEPERAGRMLNRAGMSLFLTSQYQDAIAIHHQAITAFQQAGAKTAEAISWAHLAVFSYIKGDFSQMFAAYARAGSLWQMTHNEGGLRLGRLLLAHLNLGAGNKQQAEAMLRQLLTETPIGRTNEWDQLYREDILMVLGLALQQQGKPHEALVYLEEALSLAHQSRNAFIEGLTLHHMGWALRDAKEPQKALAYYQQAAALWERVGWRHGLGDLYLSLGNLYVDLGRKKDAIQTYQRSLSAEGNGNSQQLFNILCTLAQVQHDEGELKEALVSTEQAIRLLEGLVSQTPTDSLRVGFYKTGQQAYELRQDLLMHLQAREPSAGYDVAAFEASESSRARALRQYLQEKQLLPAESNDPALTKQADNLRQQLAALTSEQVRLKLTAAQRTNIANKQLSLLAELENITIRIQEGNSQSATLAIPKTYSLCEIQRQILAPDTTVLEYQLGKERSFLFAITKNSFQTFVLPRRALIEQTARNVYEALARTQQPQNFSNAADKQKWIQQNEQQCAQAAQQLSAMILAPAAKIIKNKRLLIVPDGALYYIPFAVLPAPQNQSATLARPKTKNLKPKTQPLIVNHEIISLPSVSTLALLRSGKQRQQLPAKTLAIFADPVFDQYDERLKLPATQKASPLAINDTVHAFGNRSKEGNFVIPRLPASRSEAEAIAELVPNNERTLALGFEANYQAVEQTNLSEYRFVHFATHGILDEARPELSGLLLSQINRDGKSENGYFTTLDAFNLNLNAELVVLSGCRTALGKEFKGEGLLGLSRGFMYAGARRVMASLWQVNDAATAQLMKCFYEQLLGEKKLAPAAALRAAQIELLQSKQWRAPYYWAAFTMQGDW